MQATGASQIGPILVIDDEPELCELVGLVLDLAGFEVLSAHDGLSGIELAQRVRPAVILLDMIMPVLDGVSTCLRFKEDADLRGIPVIGITASTSVGYTEHAFRAGAEFFLAKPFGKESLVQAIDLAIKRAQREAGRRSQARVQAALPVRCVIPRERDEAREIVGRTANVSLDGLLLWLPETLATGSVLRLQVQVPEGAVTVEGTVVWRGDVVGDQIIPHGVQVLGFVEEAEFLRYTDYLAQKS